MIIHLTKLVFFFAILALLSVFHSGCKKPEILNPLSLIIETARQEIDNTALLIQLLESTNEIILDLAPSKEEEDIRTLGPDIIEQLKLKLKIMNSKWLDYNRIFTTPRP